ncbi:antibiotic biosynthesis monooxygenase family protein [Oceanospirillum sediminis]|uniref:Antibiotic biosynthesis monooxygenase n=1 Tax=Oceanospirillum sediminis TaxID=2760088 RepID=A0A839INB6_9GAMM|nr:antibiotic biosynthesis monooxygenase [Oceanospirillum sediminis]MBB1486190.1 antibiotic biosynthesis monooxygenase [Oceanospirillum sediminis]
MITRIFEVEINPVLRTEFEHDFSNLALPATQATEGCLTVSIGKPTQWTPNTYLMISQWESVQSLINFAGENWGEAVIPDAMARYAAAYRVSHFENWPSDMAD